MGRPDTSGSKRLERELLKVSVRQDGGARIFYKKIGENIGRNSEMSVGLGVLSGPKYKNE